MLYMLQGLVLAENQAKALAILCDRFQYGDAQHFLHDKPNISPDRLCEAISIIRQALDNHGIRR